MLENKCRFFCKFEPIFIKCYNSGLKYFSFQRLKVSLNIIMYVELKSLDGQEGCKMLCRKLLAKLIS